MATKDDTLSRYGKHKDSKELNQMQASSPRNAIKGGILDPGDLESMTWQDYERLDQKQIKREMEDLGESVLNMLGQKKRSSTASNPSKSALSVPLITDLVRRLKEYDVGTYLIIRVDYSSTGKIGELTILYRYNQGVCHIPIIRVKMRRKKEDYFTFDGEKLFTRVEDLYHHYSINPYIYKIPNSEKTVEVLLKTNLTYQHDFSKGTKLASNTVQPAGGGGVIDF